MTHHDDDQGKPCTRHAPPDPDVMLAWAAVGSRISGFHHDTASKLQSMMMSLDEAIDVLGTSNPELAGPLETAMGSLRELNALLTENRALAKAPQRKQTAVADLVKRAAARYGIRLQGELGSATVVVAPPSMTHALALLCDHVAGPMQSARTVTISVGAAEADAVTIEIAGTPPEKPSPTSNEAIAIAAFLLAREDASMRCTPRGFSLQLPTSARSAGDKP
jgi:hypothetical protein